MRLNTEVRSAAVAGGLTNNFDEMNEILLVGGDANKSLEIELLCEVSRLRSSMRQVSDLTS